MWFDFKKYSRRNFNYVFLLIILFSVGCSFSVPEPDESNQALLIIPVETRQTLKQFIWTLHITIEDTSSNEKYNHVHWPDVCIL